jgi:hypothetical protein
VGGRLCGAYHAQTTKPAALARVTSALRARQLSRVSALANLAGVDRAHKRMLARFRRVDKGCIQTFHLTRWHFSGRGCFGISGWMPPALSNKPFPAAQPPAIEWVGGRPGIINVISRRARQRLLPDVMRSPTQMSDPALASWIIAQQNEVEPCFREHGP